MILRGVPGLQSIGLVDQAARPQFKASPTLAAGDFKITKDGGALANLATLPTVSPAASKIVDVTWSATEATSTRFAIIASDAAGAEWDDAIIAIETDDVEVTFSGLAQAGSTTSVTLPASASAVTDFYQYGSALIVQGTGQGQAPRWITAYNGSTKVATVTPAFATAPDTTSYVAIKAEDYVTDVRLWQGVAPSALLSGRVDVSVGTIQAAALALINAEIVDALAVDTYAESSAVPAATATLAEKIRWLATLARNKITQTASLQTLRNDADSGNVATSIESYDGTTFTRGEWS